ncbi:MAG: tyrosine recombinase [Oscillospiraceae bacterium]|jgi:integrase/recombinase XerD|nr:tyrosine recombinase [Oscillospiraceae bacterium]
MEDHSAMFREHLSLKGKSSNTLESYMRDISQLNRFLELHGIAKVSEITDKLISKYVEYLQANGKSASTVIRTLASARSYFQFLQGLGMLDVNPAANIKLPKQEKKLPEILTGKETELLLSQPNLGDSKGCRDKAMMEILYATGIRVSELIDLDVSDLNVQINIIHCHNAKAERVIPIYPMAAKAAADYLSRVRSVIVTDKNNKALFTNMNGERLTRQGFWKIIKQYTQQANIKKDITPHTLRHSFAAHLLENGAQLKDIQEMLGHADISSTQVYAQLMRDKYTNAYKKYHPRAK